MFEIVAILIKMVINKGDSDETSVFGFLLAFQIVAIISVVSIAGWSAFSRPW